MARAIIGFFYDYEAAVQNLEDLVANDYNPDYINLVYLNRNLKDTPVEYDNTMEQAPVIEFRGAFFGADITEEDSIYYSELLHKGHAILAVFVPTNPAEDRNWEEEAAEAIADFLSEGGAYDREIRKIYGNRAALTTYPQNRWIDPVGPNKIERDRIYNSRSPLNGEVSNVIGVQEKINYLEELEEVSGRTIMSGSEVLATRNRS